MSISSSSPEAPPRGADIAETPGTPPRGADIAETPGTPPCGADIAETPGTPPRGADIAETPGTPPRGADIAETPGTPIRGANITGTLPLGADIAGTPPLGADIAETPGTPPRGVDIAVTPGTPPLGADIAETPGTPPCGADIAETPGTPPLGADISETPGTPPCGADIAETPGTPPCGADIAETPGTPPHEADIAETPGTPPLGADIAETPGTPPCGADIAETPGTPPLGADIAETPGTPPLGAGIAETPGTPPCGADIAETPGTPPHEADIAETPRTPREEERVFCEANMTGSPDSESTASEHSEIKCTLVSAPSPEGTPTQMSPETKPTPVGLDVESGPVIPEPRPSPPTLVSPKNKPTPVSTPTPAIVPPLVSPDATPIIKISPTPDQAGEEMQATTAKSPLPPHDVQGVDQDNSPLQVVRPVSEQPIHAVCSDTGQVDTVLQAFEGVGPLKAPEERLASVPSADVSTVLVPQDLTGSDMPAAAEEEQEQDVSISCVVGQADSELSCSRPEDVPSQVVSTSEEGLQVVIEHSDLNTGPVVQPSPVEAVLSSPNKEEVISPFTHCPVVKGEEMVSSRCEQPEQVRESIVPGKSVRPETLVPLIDKGSLDVEPPVSSAEPLVSEELLNIKSPTSPVLDVESPVSPVLVVASLGSGVVSPESGAKSPGSSAKSPGSGVESLASIMLDEESDEESLESDVLDVESPVSPGLDMKSYVSHQFSPIIVSAPCTLIGLDSPGSTTSSFLLQETTPISPMEQHFSGGELSQTIPSAEPEVEQCADTASAEPKEELSTGGTPSAEPEVEQCANTVSTEPKEELSTGGTPLAEPEGATPLSKEPLSALDSVPSSEGMSAPHTSPSAPTNAESDVLMREQEVMGTVSPVEHTALELESGQLEFSLPSETPEQKEEVSLVEPVPEVPEQREEVSLVEPPEVPEQREEVSLVESAIEQKEEVSLMEPAVQLEVPEQVEEVSPVESAIEQKEEVSLMEPAVQLEVPEQVEEMSPVESAIEQKEEVSLMEPAVQPEVPEQREEVSPVESAIEQKEEVSLMEPAVQPEVPEQRDEVSLVEPSLVQPDQLEERSPVEPSTQPEQKEGSLVECVTPSELIQGAPAIQQEAPDQPEEVLPIEPAGAETPEEAEGESPVVPIKPTEEGLTESAKEQRCSEPLIAESTETEPQALCEPETELKVEPGYEERTESAVVLEGPVVDEQDKPLDETREELEADQLKEPESMFAELQDTEPPCDHEDAAAMLEEQVEAAILSGEQRSSHPSSQLEVPLGSNSPRGTLSAEQVVGAIPEVEPVCEQHTDPAEGLGADRETELAIVPEREETEPLSDKQAEPTTELAEKLKPQPAVLPEQAPEQTEPSQQSEVAPEETSILLDILEQTPELQPPEADAGDNPAVEPDDTECLFDSAADDETEWRLSLSPTRVDGDDGGVELEEEEFLTSGVSPQRANPSASSSPRQDDSTWSSVPQPPVLARETSPPASERSDNATSPPPLSTSLRCGVLAANNEILSRLCSPEIPRMEDSSAIRDLVEDHTPLLDTTSTVISLSSSSASSLSFASSLGALPTPESLVDLSGTSSNLSPSPCKVASKSAKEESGIEVGDESLVCSKKGEPRAARASDAPSTLKEKEQQPSKDPSTSASQETEQPSLVQGNSYKITPVVAELSLVTASGTVIVDSDAAWRSAQSIAEGHGSNFSSPSVNLNRKSVFKRSPISPILRQKCDLRSVIGAVISKEKSLDMLLKRLQEGSTKRGKSTKFATASGKVGVPRRSRKLEPRRTSAMCLSSDVVPSRPVDLLLDPSPHQAQRRKRPPPEDISIPEEKKVKKIRLKLKGVQPSSLHSSPQISPSHQRKKCGASRKSPESLVVSLPLFIRKKTPPLISEGSPGDLVISFARLQVPSPRTGKFAASSTSADVAVCSPKEFAITMQAIGSEKASNNDSQVSVSKSDVAIPDPAVKKCTPTSELEERTLCSRALKISVPSGEHKENTPSETPSTLKKSTPTAGVIAPTSEQELMSPSDLCLSTPKQSGGSKERSSSELSLRALLKSTPTAGGIAPTSEQEQTSPSDPCLSTPKQAGGSEAESSSELSLRVLLKSTPTSGPETSGLEERKLRSRTLKISTPGGRSHSEPRSTLKKSTPTSGRSTPTSEHGERRLSLKTPTEGRSLNVLHSKTPTKGESPSGPLLKTPIKSIIFVPDSPDAPAPKTGSPLTVRYRMLQSSDTSITPADVASKSSLVNPSSVVTPVFAGEPNVSEDKEASEGEDISDDKIDAGEPEIVASTDVPEDKGNLIAEDKSGDKSDVAISGKFELLTSPSLPELTLLLQSVKARVILHLLKTKMM